MQIHDPIYLDVYFQQIHERRFSTMMTKCPECGSNDIIPDLLVNTDAANPNHKPAYVKLLEPPPAERPNMWIPQEVRTEFYAAICGSCGFTRLYTKQHIKIWEAHQKGYISQT
jgi:predicted nucleic-acid-binding Zn-ribbon protein